MQDQSTRNKKNQPQWRNGIEPPGYQEYVARSFWERVNKTDGCWLWAGTLMKNGYGQFSLRQCHIYPHRFSWELHNGPIPAGLYVCHRCDTKLCVNPAHLFLGTQKDNMEDAARKGRIRGAQEWLRGHPERHPSHLHPERMARGDKNGARTHPESRLRGDAWLAAHDATHPRGSRNGNAKLTEEIVAEARRRRAAGEKYDVLAKDYGVNNSKIRAAVRGETWKHVPMTERPETAPPEGQNQAG